MPTEFYQSWSGIIATCISIATAIYSWVTRDARQAQAEVKALRDKVEVLEDRVSKAEGELSHLPDKDTAHRMEMAIARLEGRLETMDERLKPVAAMATRMQDYLIEAAK